MAPPRALWVPFPLGRPLGAAGDAAFQHRVIAAALALLDRPEGPVLEDFPETAPDDGSGEPWSCPVRFPRAAVGEDIASVARAELGRLDTWQALATRRRTRTAAVTSGLAIAQCLELVIDACHAGETDDVRRLKAAIEDLKTHYTEAVTARPGTPAARRRRHDAVERVRPWPSSPGPRGPRLGERRRHDAVLRKGFAGSAAVSTTLKYSMRHPGQRDTRLSRSVSTSSTSADLAECDFRQSPPQTGGQAMRLPKRPGKMLACALLAAAVLGTAPDAPHAQAGADTRPAARFLERPSEAMAAAQMRRPTAPPAPASSHGPGATRMRGCRTRCTRRRRTLQPRRIHFRSTCKSPGHGRAFRAAGGDGGALDASPDAPHRVVSVGWATRWVARALRASSTIPNLTARWTSSPGTMRGRRSVR